MIGGVAALAADSRAATAANVLMLFMTKQYSIKKKKVEEVLKDDELLIQIQPVSGGSSYEKCCKE